MIAILLIVIAIAVVVIAIQVSRQAADVSRAAVKQLAAESPDVPASVVELAKAGRRIEALRAYREHSGCSLEIAMAKVDAIK